MPDLTAFIQAHAQPASPSLVPELTLYMAQEVTPLWQATEADLAKQGLPPPYWAFAWPGGQALARYLLDHPQTAQGQRVLDFASGSGVVALAAAKTGAVQVTAAEIDPYATVAIALNAQANHLRVQVTSQDVIGQPLDDYDLILAGDVCYEQPMAHRVVPWLQQLAAAGKTVLLGDPGRKYRPEAGLTELARYLVPTSLDLEDKTIKETVVWQVAT